MALLHNLLDLSNVGLNADDFNDLPC